MNPGDQAERGAETASAAEVRALLARILGSRHFAGSARRRQFLSLVCDFHLEGRAAELTEFTIGCEVFARDGNFNPGEDPSVRVCAHEVRKKLAAYFHEEGRDETLVLEIPPGGYQPAFVRARQPAVAVPVPAPAPQRRIPRWTLVAALLAVAVAALAARATWFGGPAPLRMRDSIWRAFVEDRNPTLVVISNPPAFGFLNGSEAPPSKDRSVPLNPAQIAQLAPNPQIPWNYVPTLVPQRGFTGVGEAISLYQIGRYFAVKGHDLLIKQSLTTSAEDLKGHNAVILGGPLSNRWASSPPYVDFELADNCVRNRNPRPGELRQYTLVQNAASTEPVTDFALVTVVPNLTPEHSIMMLMGIRGEGCQAAAEFVTGDWYLKHLQSRLDASTRYFQALLRVDVRDHIPASISLVAVHAVKVPASN